MNLDQVLTNYDESTVKELQHTLESQLDQRTPHHQQPHTNFTSGNNSYYNTHSSSDNGIFTYNSNSSNASQSRVSSNYHPAPYLLQQQQHHHPNHRQEHFSHRGLEPPPHIQYQQQQKFNGGGHLGGGYLGSGGGVMHHQFSSHSQHPNNYISSEQNNNTKTYNNHINTNTNPNNSKNNNISGGDSVNRSIYHQNNNNNHNFNNYNNNNNNNQDIRDKNNTNTASSNSKIVNSNMPTNEPVKLVYPVSGTVTPTNSNATTIVTGGQAGQAHHLPNGTISLSQMTGNPGGGGATIISSPAGLVKTGGHGQGISQTLIIKNPQGIMTSSAPGMVTMTKTMNNQVSQKLYFLFIYCVFLWYFFNKKKKKLF